MQSSTITTSSATSSKHQSPMKEMSGKISRSEVSEKDPNTNQVVENRPHRQFEKKQGQLGSSKTAILATGAAMIKQVDKRAQVKQGDKNEKHTSRNKPRRKRTKPTHKPNEVKEEEKSESKKMFSSKTGNGKEANFIASTHKVSNWEPAQESDSCDSLSSECQSSSTDSQLSTVSCESTSPEPQRIKHSLPIVSKASQAQKRLLIRKLTSQRNHKMETWDDDLAYHQEILDTTVSAKNGGRAEQGVLLEEIKTTPLFFANVLRAVIEADASVSSSILPQYGLIASVMEYYNDQESGLSLDSKGTATEDSKQNGDEKEFDISELKLSSLTVRQPDTLLFLNINTPWSAFICGSQGSGKSHTLSCMLESALQPSRLGPLVAPLAGMVFHYDKLTGFGSSQICEAAYLCSTGIPVQVLVSPSSFCRMKQVYENLPGVPRSRLPKVVPLLFTEAQLNVERMMKLMAVEDESRSALYMEVVIRILRSMALRNPEKPGLDYREFKRRIEIESFQPQQITLIDMRLGLLESFMLTPGAATDLYIQSLKPYFEPTRHGKQQEREWNENLDRSHRASLGDITDWTSAPGSLTIVDLSCPFIDESAACALFNISLALFLDGRKSISTTTEEESKTTGLILALDEAHKFMTPSSSSTAFTETLLSIIRQQRHLATRVIIATQEPTISPALLDLCSMTIVHRFSSPEWLKALAGHLAGVAGEEAGQKKGNLMARIVALEAGEGLVFCPAAMVGTERLEGIGLKGRKLGLGALKVRVRKRLTEDGGRSILAA